MKKDKSILRGAGLVLIGLIGFALPSTCSAWNRIVTLNPMASEWAAEIMGEESALKKIVGVSEYSNFPEYMKKVQTIGPYPQIHIEGVLSLKPDLVVASAEYNRPEQIEKLKKLKLNVIVLPRESLFKMEEWILAYGKALNEKASALRAVKKWNLALAEIKKPNSIKNVFLQIQFQPLITVGQKSFLNDAFEIIGFKNIFKSIDLSYPKISMEAVIEKNPDEVFVFEMVKNQDDLKKINSTWKSSKVRVLNGDDFSRCSLRLLRALKELR